MFICVGHVKMYLLEKQHVKNKANIYTPVIKVQHHPLHSTTSPSSKYHTTLFKVPHHPLQSTTPPSSKYHTTLFKVPHHLLHSNTPVIMLSCLFIDSFHIISFVIRAAVFTTPLLKLV